MIQRIQTVFLFLAIVALGLFLWMPAITLEALPYSKTIKGFEVGHFIPINGERYFTFFTAIFAGTAMGFTLLAIFLFKKRNIQMLFCWFAIIFIVTAQAYVYYMYYTWMFNGDVVLRKLNLLTVVALLFEILAIVYIRKDEETIKSLDRLR